MTSRRDFLKTSARRATLVAVAPSIPTFLARAAHAVTPDRDRPILVVIELAGGNDGINTVVPFRDEGYARHRTTLRLPADRVLKLSGDVGLNPAMRGLMDLWHSGSLAIVQGVSYPNPNRSHFESRSIWYTARPGGSASNALGWIGLGLDNARSPKDSGAAALFVGENSPPVALRGRRSVAASLDQLDDFRLRDERFIQARSPQMAEDLASFVERSALDAYTTAERIKSLGGGTNGAHLTYPATRLGGRLKTIASLIRGGMTSRVYYTEQPGYDTHALQLNTHNALLGELADALGSFHRDLSAAGLSDRVVTLCFSEFGRRVAENGGRGTDHGTAGPVFLLGPSVKGGLVGPTPSLTDLDHGDLKWSTDFRRVYAAILSDWLGVDPRTALGGDFAPLDVIRA
jgi:uncharacterized protein (DUF1501 family)